MTTPEEAIRLARTLREARRRLWEHLFSYHHAPRTLLTWARELGVEPSSPDAESLWMEDDGRVERAALQRLESGYCYGRVRPTSARWRAYLAQAQACARDVRRARDAMITANMPLAAHLASRPQEDVCQGAFEGLIVAVDRYRPEKGFRFSTYARWWIHHKAVKAARERHLVKMGKVHIAMRKMVRNASPTGTETVEEIAHRSGLSREDVEEVLAGPRINVGSGPARATALIDPTPPADVTLMERQMQDAVRESVERLAPRARTIIHKRYLNGHKATLPTLGKELGCSREWVRLMEREAFYFIGEAISAAGFAP